MKKILIIIIVLEILLIINPQNIANTSSIAVNNTEEVINMQKDNLKISDFIKESESYTKESMPDIDLNKLLSTAMTGKIDNIKLIRLIYGLLGKEILNSLTVIGSIIIIIVIHGILKSISDGFENKSVSQITYYVQYILIVSLVLTNFADIINMIKESIQNLVGLMNSLVPILITLILTTGNIVSARNVAVNNIIYDNFNRKFYSRCNFTNGFNFNSFRYCISNI